jgi:hypothetical protein
MLDELGHQVWIGHAASTSMKPGRVKRYSGRLVHPSIRGHTTR